MQSNEKCIKAILKYVDEHTGVEIDTDDDITISEKSTELYTVISELSKNGEFKQEEVAYNALLCEKFGFIRCNFMRNKNGDTLIIGSCPIFDTMPRGEAFLRGEIEL